MQAKTSKATHTPSIVSLTKFRVLLERSDGIIALPFVWRPLEFYLRSYSRMKKEIPSIQQPFASLEYGDHDTGETEEEREAFGAGHGAFHEAPASRALSGER
jgi:hypothetical protein